MEFSRGTGRGWEGVVRKHEFAKFLRFADFNLSWKSTPLGVASCKMNGGKFLVFKN